MSLKILTANPTAWKSFLEYCDERIDLAHKDLERANTIEETKKAQGRIEEIRLLKGLRDKLEGSKDER